MVNTALEEYLIKMQSIYYNTATTAEDSIQRLVALKRLTNLAVDPTIAVNSSVIDECLSKMQLCGRAIELCQVNPEDEELAFILEILEGKIPLEILPRAIH